MYYITDLKLLEECNIYKPGWNATFLQEASQLVQMQVQEQTLQMQKMQEQENTTTIVEEIAETDQEARDRIAQELIDDEELSKTVKKRKNSKKKSI